MTKKLQGNIRIPWSLRMRSFWKISFIYPPEVRGQIVSLKEMVGYDSRKIAQNRTGVKGDFGLSFSSIFQTQDRKEPQHLGGVFGCSKVKQACHTRNCLIFLPYCTNGLYLTTFLGFKFSTNIADNKTPTFKNRAGDLFPPALQRVQLRISRSRLPTMALKTGRSALHIGRSTVAR